ncbi:MAG: Lrp/AsnC ligand binding domain-containing protein [Spirochaetales bacterium]|nr:Lrp/AsnC ligand binding domain-containing protein [Spirochaetales bacterium]
MEDKHKVDNLDINILSILQEDSRKSFQEIARELVVSGGTIHVRMNRLKELGIVSGSRIILDYPKLGFDVTVFIGINLHNASDSSLVLSKLNEMKEITEVHYTTGSYSLFIKAVLRSTLGLKIFLVEKLQRIPEIQSTETLISLDEPVSRDIQLDLS